MIVHAVLAGSYSLPPRVDLSSSLWPQFWSCPSAQTLSPFALPPVAVHSPFHWLDRRGNWHILAHQYIWPNFSNPVSGHAYSTDGTKWHFAANQPFAADVCQDPKHRGSPFTSACGSRERPFLVFDGTDQMRPTHLVSAVNSVCQGGDKSGTGKDWTYTLVQPIN